MTNGDDMQPTEVREDPPTFRIEPDGGDSTWRWVSLADEATRDGFASRDDAIDDALGVLAALGAQRPV